jgi:hypothetical protein
MAFAGIPIAGSLSLSTQETTVKSTHPYTAEHALNPPLATLSWRKRKEGIVGTTRRTTK